MAQETAWRIDEAATFVGRESTFQSPSGAPSMTRATPCSGSVALDPTQAEIEIDDESVYLHNYQSPVLGMQDGSFGLDYYLKPATTQLVSAATPDTTPLGIFLKACFGDEVAAAGSAVSASADDVHATVGDGTLFKVGGWALAPFGGSTLPVRVSAIATNDLTFDLGVGNGNTVTTSADLVNMHNWYPKQGSAESVYIQHAKAGSSTNHKWAFKGCIAESLDFEIARNQALKAKFKFKAASWEHTSDDSIAVTYAADGMATPFAMQGATFILQSTGTATRTPYPMLSFGVKLNLGMEFAMDLGGTTQGKAAAYRDGQRMFAEATIKTVTADAAVFNTWWQSRTALQCVLMIPSGSGATKRWLVIDLPNCIVVNAPKTVGEKKLAVTEFTVRTKMRSTSASTDQGRAPFALAIG